MSINGYGVPDDPFVSTSTENVNSCGFCHDTGVERQWNIQDVYASEFTLDSLVRTLDVIDIFKRKYPNDDIVQNFEDIVRDEICQLFGGSILNLE